MSVRESWQRIAKWAADNIPDGKFRLASGASSEQIDELEAVLGFPLPEDVRESYLAHNGTDETPFPFKNQEHSSLSFIAAVYPMYKTFATGPNNEVATEVEGPIKPIFWSLHRVPLTEDGGGSSLMIDLDPAEGGTVGQVIEHNRDLGPVRVIATSWGELLKTIADDAEAGRYIYGKDGDFWGLVDGGE
jgi:cell wall assembly regulator SMI1